MAEKLIYKVLLIDDDEAIFNLLKSRIKKEGLFLIWAKDGEEGIRKAKIEMPDLVVTDVVMPKANGFQVLKELKEKVLTKDLKFIILSNYGETRLVYDKEFLESLGVCKYLIKSNHTPVQIIREIKEAIG